MQKNDESVNTKLKMCKTLKLEDFQLGEIIGTGCFAKVRISKNLKTKKFYAVKEMKKKHLLMLRQVDHIASEIKIMNEIDHKFIVKIEGLMQDDKKIYIVQEMANGGELFTYLRVMRKLDIESAKFYVGQIVLIFEYLHSKNIIYRDLKPENVLFDKTGYLKLCDFGFAKYCDSRTYTLCGTPEYLAPEILLNKGHGKPVDWWTLGVFLYELLKGVSPFADDSPLNVYKKILSGKIHFSKEFDKDAKRLIKNLVQPDLSKRYGNLSGGAGEIKNTKFFYNLDFLKLENYALKPPYFPNLMSMSDTSNFSKYPDSGKECITLSQKEDPFLNW